MRVLVLGTVALDSVITAAGKRDNLLGGSAVHFAMSSRFLAPTHIVAVVGKDFPEKHTRFLAQKGIAIDSLEKTSGKTFRWAGDYRKDLNSACTLDTKLGVLATFMPTLTQPERAAKHVFLANVDPDIQSFLLRKVRNPELIGLDSMNYWITQKRKSLKKILFLIIITPIQLKY
ncbi:hypothetical protein ACFL1E_06650 [Candidatus Omnitrophota bacterium]